jgi:uncharacterized protein (TIRG00374 family)
LKSKDFWIKAKKFFQQSPLSFTIRLLISGFLLFFLFIKLDVIDKIATIFKNINFSYLLVYFFLYVIAISFQVLRWQYLLQVWGIRQKYSNLFRWTMTGLFLNNFLPGGLGGDAFRLYSGTRNSENIENTAATIFYERILSYGALVIMGLISLVIRGQYFEEDRLFLILLGSVFLGLTGIFFILAIPGIRNFLIRISQKYPFLQKMRLAEWFDSFRFKVYHPGKLVVVFLISLVIQFIDVFSYFLVAIALRLPVHLNELFLFVPLLNLAVLIPLSVNGIGIRETVFVSFSSIWGISQGNAVAFSITVFSLNLIGSLIGGPIYWIDRRQYKKPSL